MPHESMKWPSLFYNLLTLSPCRTPLLSFHTLLLHLFMHSFIQWQYHHLFPVIKVIRVEVLFVLYNLCPFPPFTPPHLHPSRYSPLHPSIHPFIHPSLTLYHWDIEQSIVSHNLLGQFQCVPPFFLLPHPLPSFTVSPYHPWPWPLCKKFNVRKLHS